MAYRYFNPNPSGKKVGDCVIRGISFLTSQDWEETYLTVAMQGFEMFEYRFIFGEKNNGKLF